MIPELAPYTVLNMYLVGSTVYGYKDPSDSDYIVIVEEDTENFQILSEDCDYSVYSKKAFDKMIVSHDPLAIECCYLPSEFILQENYQLKQSLNKNTLRNSFSQKASNSWVKARKKLTIPADYNLIVAQKSLFHSLRILDFAIDLAKNNSISFSQSNHYWKEIHSTKDWPLLKNRFKKIYNQKKSLLRSLCPKV